MAENKQKKAKPIRLVFLGPPGSGKGTYAQRIAPRLKITHIAAGEVLREEISAGTELGKRASGYVSKGQLVPDGVVISAIQVRLEKALKETRGFLLDGFPRNMEQALQLEKATAIDVVINLDVPESVIVERLSARRQCEKCEKIYNIKFLKPKKEGICDVCGGKLFQRKDDTPEVIKQRLKIYEEQTAPLIDFYKAKGLLQTVTCTQVDIPPEIMVKEILGVLEKLKII